MSTKAPNRYLIERIGLSWIVTRVYEAYSPVARKPAPVGYVYRKMLGSAEEAMDFARMTEDKFRSKNPKQPQAKFFREET